MSISFRGAKKYKKHNGFDKSAEIHSPLPAPVYFFNLVQNTDVTLSPLVEVGDTVEIGSKIADLESYDAMPLYSSVSGTPQSKLKKRMILILLPRVKCCGLFVRQVFVKSETVFRHTYF